MDPDECHVADTTVFSTQSSLSMSPILISTFTFASLLLQYGRPLFFERWLHDGRHHIMGAFGDVGAGEQLLASDTVGLFDDNYR